MRRAAALLAIAGGVLALDQWTKRLATLHLAGRPSIDVIGEYVRLTFAQNSGVAFSLGAGTRFPFYLFSIAAAVVILWLLARGRVPRVGQQVALALILGGALGNLVDRITTGQVVDFIEVGLGRFRWPVFNVADSAVSIGVVLFLLLGSTSHPQAGTATEGGLAPDAPHEPGAESTREGSYAEVVETFDETDETDDTHTGTTGDAGPGGRAAGPLPRDGSGGSVA